MTNATQEQQKTWKLVMWVDTPADIEDVEIGKFLDECASLASTPSHFAQVVSTDFNEDIEYWKSVS